MTRSFAGRVPPNDLDAEAAVLSAVLLSRDAFDVVVDILSPEQFYSDANAAVFEAATALARSGRPIDLVSVASWLRDRERLDAAGGPSYLAQLCDATPAVANVEAHANIVRAKHRVRLMIAACHRIAAEGYSDVGDGADWFSEAEAAIAAVANDEREGATITMKQALADVFKRLADGEDDAYGMTTGLWDLDRVLGPMKPGQLILLAAGSGIGKSALGLNITVNVCCDAIDPPNAAAIFSAEMTSEEIALRALFAAARVDSAKATRKKNITSPEWSQLAGAAAAVGKETCWIDDRTDLTPLQIKAKIRRLAADAKKQGAILSLVVVDYIQLLNGRAGLPRDANREAEVNALGRALKNIAKECGVTVLALAQLNSDSSKRKDQKPRMADLRESKALGMHADKIVLIHNPNAVARAQADRTSRDEIPETEEVDLIVDKNRGGRVGTVKVMFFPHLTLFANLQAQGAR